MTYGDGDTFLTYNGQDVTIDDDENIASAGSLNRYAYCGGNPVSYVDPEGEFAESVNNMSGWKKVAIGTAAIVIAGGVTVLTGGAAAPVIAAGITAGLALEPATGRIITGFPVR